MTGLILKDFINLKKNLKIFAVLTVLYGVMSFTSADSSFFSTIFTMLFAILTLSIYSYDEMAKWDGYCLTMPISRDNIVQGKYIMMLLLTLLGSLFSALFTLILNISTKSAFLFENVQNCAVGAAIVILFYSVTLPFITKLGVEKARLIFFAVYIIPFLAIMLISKLIKEGRFTMPRELTNIITFSMDKIYIILPIVVLAALVISYLISVGIYRKKEF